MASAAAATAAAPDAAAATGAAKCLRTFTVAEVEQRCQARAHIRGYRALLMEAAVDSLPDGIVFNVKHPSWTKLVRLVQEYDQARVSNRDGGRKATDSHTPPSSVISSASLSASASDPFSLEAECSNALPNLSRIRRHTNVDHIDDGNRALVWKALLGRLSSSSSSSPASSPEKDLSGCAFDLFNQRVIRLDIERTRPDLHVFSDPEVRRALELVLTVYCKRHLINYKQGLNYMAAPFFVVLGHSDLVGLYVAFTCFLRRHAGNIFTDDQFGGLQCIFRMFRLLLLYHHPRLCNFLDDHDMSPELYASPWFMTLFANRLDLPLLLRLWDHIILHPEPLVFYFFALAFLVDRADNLMAISPVVLPEKLSQLSLTSIAQVDSLFAEGRRLLSATPESFLAYFRNVTCRNVTVDSPLYAAVAELYCLPVSAEEIVAHCFDSERRDIAAYRYFVIDCRPSQHYNAGHLPLAYHLDPALYLQPDKLARRLEILSSMQGCHFCFLSGPPADPRAKQHFAGLLMFFLKTGFPYVSACQGGFSACHDLVTSAAADPGHELIDHRPPRCHECARSSSRGLRSSRSGFLASVRQRLTGAPASASAALSASSAAVLSPLSTSSERRSRSSIDVSSAGSAAAAAAAAVAALAEPSLPQVGVPTSVSVLPPSTELRLLFTSVRDHATSRAQFTASATRIVCHLCAAVVEDLPTRECVVCSGGDTQCCYTGALTVPAVVGVGVSAEGSAALEAALQPFAAVARCQVAHMQMREKYCRAGDGVLRAQRFAHTVGVPEAAAAGSCVLLLLLPVIRSMVEPCELVAQLRTRGHHVADITVMCVVAARHALWQIAAKYPGLRIVAGAVDQLRNGRLQPGCPDFDSTYVLPPPPLPPPEQQQQQPAGGTNAVLSRST